MFYYGLGLGLNEGVALNWYDGNNKGTVTFTNENEEIDVDGETYQVFSISSINGKDPDLNFNDSELATDHTHDFIEYADYGDYSTSFTYYDASAKTNKECKSERGHFAVCSECDFMLEVDHRLSGDGAGCLDCNVAHENSYSFTIKTETIEPEDWTENDGNGAMEAKITIKVDFLQMFVGSTLNLMVKCPCLAYVTKYDTEGKVTETDSNQRIYYSLSAESFDTSSGTCVGNTIEFSDDSNLGEYYPIWTCTANTADYIEKAEDLWTGVNWNFDTDTAIKEDEEGFEELYITITLTILEDGEDSDYGISNSNLVGNFYCELVFKVDEGIVE